MQPLDFIILGGVLLLAIGAIWFYRRRKKAGKVCGSGCAGCPYSSTCQQKENQSPPNQK